MSSAIIWPVADTALAREILDLVQESFYHKQLRKGPEDSLKTLDRGISEIIILAADASVPDDLEPITSHCEEEGVPHVYVPSRMELGRACGVSRDVIAALITVNEKSDLADQIASLREKVRKLTG